MHIHLVSQYLSFSNFIIFLSVEGGGGGVYLHSSSDVIDTAAEYKYDVTTVRHVSLCGVGSRNEE